ncbi:MAG: hypothetical protein AUI12_05055 [Acidobacteria bacterium 13_2_20CM_2_57_6]|nr:MAG: hypothetical protein AUI12_05055 [Acidobacteria bacterium 13_2_20CM_2_57_6]PYT44050.1 MAG: hypothetical protein DMG45_05160 [Acidobacteriota bacterium]PYT60922.1 MAG: hypothetical protein DMG46_06150 [Acidobacteriota bacterium]
MEMRSFDVVQPSSRNNETGTLFESFEAVAESAGEVAENCLKQAGAEVAFPKVLLDTIASSTTRVCTVRSTRGTP